MPLALYTRQTVLTAAGSAAVRLRLRLAAFTDDAYIARSGLICLERTRQKSVYFSISVTMI